MGLSAPLRQITLKRKKAVGGGGRIFRCLKSLSLTNCIVLQLKIIEQKLRKFYLISAEEYSLLTCVDFCFYCLVCTYIKMLMIEKNLNNRMSGCVRTSYLRAPWATTSYRSELHCSLVLACDYWLLGGKNHRISYILSHPKHVCDKKT